MLANQLTGGSRRPLSHSAEAIALKKPTATIWQKAYFLSCVTGPCRMTCSELHFHASFWSFKYWFLKYSSQESHLGTFKLGFTNDSYPHAFIAGWKYRLFPSPHFPPPKYLFIHYFNYLIVNFFRGLLRKKISIKAWQ